MAQLRVQLLGPPTVEWQGEYLLIPRKRVRALLYRLALELQPVSREQLAGLLWCDLPDVAAHRDLTHLLTHLRRALPQPEMLQSTTDYVFLDRKIVWSDTSAFLALFCAPGAHLTHEVLAQALGLLRGPLMEGYSLDDGAEFEEWLTVERSIWERRAAAVVAAIEKEGVENEDLALAVRGAYYLPGAGPMSAEVHKRLVEYHLAHGDREMVRKQIEAVNEQLKEWQERI